MVDLGYYVGRPFEHHQDDEDPGIGQSCSKGMRSSATRTRT